MDIKNILTKDEQERINQLNEQLDILKVKIQTAVSNDLGINYIITEGQPPQEIDITKSIEVIPSHVSEMREIHKEIKKILQEALSRQNN